MKKWNEMIDSEAEKNTQKLTLAGQRRSLSGGNIKAESKDRAGTSQREENHGGRHCKQKVHVSMI